jgi:hypothetical protein
VAALQLAADDHLTGGIYSVDLEDRLGDIETDCRDRLHGSLLRIANAETSVGPERRSIERGG